MSTESELYNLKMKILRSKHISDQLREELANDVFEIESSIKAKNNEVLDLVSHCPLCNSDNIHQYKLHHVHCKNCKEDFNKGCC